MAFRLFLLFALFMDNTGFCAEISVSVKTGAFVQLDIQTQELAECYLLSWSNEKSENIVTYIFGTKEVKPHPIYKDRVDFNTTSFSLTLKNMQKTDSGLYSGKIHGLSAKTIATYRISVIDEVEDPVLAVTSSWSSSDSCSFTCNGSNIFTSSIFNGSSCSAEEVTSADNHTLRLSCGGDVITCNHSNPVSSKTLVKKVNELCPAETGKYEKASAFPTWIIFTLVPICLLAVILAAAIICIFKRRKGTREIEQTIYANTYEENYKPQNQLEMLEKSEKPPTVYDTVRDLGQTDGIDPITTNNHPQSASLTEKSEPNTPVTIYCTIQKQPNDPKTETDHTIYAQVNKPSAGYESAHQQSE